MTAFLFFCATLLALLGHGYFWVAIVNRLHGLASPRKLIDLGTLCCTLAFVLIPLYLLWESSDVASQWSAPCNWDGGFAVCYYRFCIVFCLGEAVAKTVFSPSRNQSEDLLEIRKQRIDMDLQIGLDVYSGAYSRRLGKIPGNQSHQLQIELKRLAIPRLHNAHAGLRIAHVSDFHLTGRLDRAWFEMVVDQVNQLRPDVVAVTGDILEHADCVPWLQSTLCRLQAKWGVYFILGNHDKFVELQRTRELLSAAGLTCLSGRWLEATWNGAPVVLAGNERPWLTEVGDLSKAPVRGEDNLPLRLFLLHSPDQIAWARQHDADLVLAGHTHGGQLCFPLLGAVACPSLYGTRYTDGVYRVGKTLMHVTRGLSGRTPLRTFCRPEIALLELAQSSTC